MKTSGFITGSDLQHDLSGVWKTEDETTNKDIPVIHDTIEEAYKDVADSLREHLRQFLDDERALEDTVFETEEEVLKIVWQDNDLLTISTLEDNLLYEVSLEDWRKSF